MKSVDYAILGIVAGASIFAVAHWLTERGALREGTTPFPPSPRSVHKFGQIMQTERLIWIHESVGGTQMSGDGGLAQGHQHHHEGTWNDGLDLLGLRNDPDWQWPGATRDLWRCYVVTIAYWQRYCPEALKSADIEMMVRSFRLPCDPYRPSNNKYLELVLGGAN